MRYLVRFSSITDEESLSQSGYCDSYLNRFGVRGISTQFHDDQRTLYDLDDKVGDPLDIVSLHRYQYQVGTWVQRP